MTEAIINCIECGKKFIFYSYEFRRFPQYCIACEEKIIKQTTKTETKIEEIIQKLKKK